MDVDTLITVEEYSKVARHDFYLTARNPKTGLYKLGERITFTDMVPLEAKNDQGTVLFTVETHRQIGKITVLSQEALEQLYAVLTEGLK